MGYNYSKTCFLEVGILEIHEIQKINSLARELMKYGQASSMEEALRLAQAQIANGGGGSTLVESATVVETEVAKAPELISEQKEESKQEEPLPIEELKSEVQQENSKSELVVQEESSLQAASVVQPTPQGDVQHNETVNKLLQISNAHTTQIKDLHAKLNSLIQEVANYKEQAKKFASSPIMVPEQNGEKKVVPQTTFKPQLKEEKKVSPRSGNYKSADVAIDKFFYCGGK